MVSGKERIYLIGGLLKNNDPSNEIFEFNPTTKEWKKIVPEGVELPPLESFSSLMISSNDEEKIIIAFGFNENKAELSNVVYEYNVSKNKMSILFEGAPEGT